MMGAFLRWSGLAAGTLATGGVALGSLYDLRVREFCYSAPDGPMYGTFGLFVLSASVMAGLVAVAVRAMR